MVYMDSASMGLVYADIELASGDDLALVRRGYLPEDQVKRLYARSLVDSGATMLAIPEFVKNSLIYFKLERLKQNWRMVQAHLLRWLGPIEIRFENRRTLVEAVVVPGATKVLLGAIPMEGMDVLIDPKRERLIVNPESPNVARMLLM